MSKSATIVSWIAQLVAAVTLGQTLFFKFTGAPEAMHIFGTLGVEPWGRYAAGFAELVTVILLLIPRTIFLGALAAAGTMVGAVGAHLGPLGIEIVNEAKGIQGDGGALFIMGVIALIASIIVITLRWNERPCLLKGSCHLSKKTNQSPTSEQV